MGFEWLEWGFESGVRVRLDSGRLAARITWLDCVCLEAQVVGGVSTRCASTADCRQKV